MTLLLLLVAWVVIAFVFAVFFGAFIRAGRGE